MRPPPPMAPSPIRVSPFGKRQPPTAAARASPLNCAKTSAAANQARQQVARHQAVEMALIRHDRPQGSRSSTATRPAQAVHLQLHEAGHSICRSAMSSTCAAKSPAQPHLAFRRRLAKPQPCTAGQRCPRDHEGLGPGLALPSGPGLIRGPRPPCDSARVSPGSGVPEPE